MVGRSKLVVVSTGCAIAVDHAFNLILGSFGPLKPISYKNLAFPSLCQTNKTTVYTHYMRFCLSSDTVKGTPDFCKKWVLGVSMAQNQNA